MGKKKNRITVGKFLLIAALVLIAAGTGVIGSWLTGGFQSPPTPNEVVRTVVVIQIQTATPMPTPTLTPRPTRVSEQGRRMIQFFDGLSLIAYWDAGKHCTIGFGHLIDDTWCVGELKTTQKQADEWFENDIRTVERFLLIELGGIPLNQCQFDAMASFAYNVGDYNFRVSGIRSALLARNNLKVLEILANRVYSNGNYLEGLVIRRAIESKLYEECIYPDMD